MSEQQIDPVVVQAFKDYGNALSIAKKYWPNGPADVVQAAAATVLIHMKQLRGGTVVGAASTAKPLPQAAPPAKAAPAPQTATKLPPDCPACGGAMWDNREGKQNPKAPDFKCKNKECKDAKGFTTSLWMRDLNKQKNTAYAEAHAVRDQFDAAAVDFNQMPPALEADDSLPF